MPERFRYELSNDAPKCTRSEDRLGHAAFAERVASVIAGVDATDGYVLGLHGTWGSGKSTTLNFIVECVQEHDRSEECSILHINFQPWLITGHHDLIGAFLKVLSEKVADRKSRLRRWSPKSAQMVKAADAVGAIVKVGTAWADPAGGLASSVAGNAARKAAATVISRFAAEPSLQSAHKEMADRLRDLGRRILVTVDDIDRLDSTEIRCMMQMVKSLGRLPNVVYLLCYDRAIVWRALDGTDNPARPSFAEKIVQQELELPVPHRTQLLRMLDEQTGFLVGHTEHTPRWDHIVRDGARRWIRTPRDVMRFANAVKFSWSALEGEIDPQDLFAMEGIRLFDSDVFDWIRENRAMLLREGRFLAAGDGAREAVAERLKQVIPEPDRPEVLDLMAAIFPQLSELLLDLPQAWTEEHADTVTRRGVGSEAGYDAYFGLFPSADAVPLSELHALMSTTESSVIEASLRRYLRQANSVGGPMIGELLEEIYIRYHGQHPAEPTEAMFKGLFAEGEEIIATDRWASGLFDVNSRSELHLIIGRMLEIWGPVQGGAQLVDAFQAADSPALLADVFESRGRELGIFESGGGANRPRVSEACFKELGDILREKIRLAESNGTLVKAPFFFAIVRSWKHLCGPDEPRRWLENGMKSDASFLVKTCRGLVTMSTGADGTEYRMRDAPDPELYELSILNDAARRHLEECDLTADERNLLSSVLDGLNRMLG